MSTAPIPRQNPKRIAIGICTCQRPKMLQRCLDSLRLQKFNPWQITVHLIIVDNERNPNNRLQIKEFAKSVPWAVVYIHEPKRGIARARNAILDSAWEMGMEWIAMIDDDEIADEGWIEALMVDHYLDTPILAGQIKYQFPEKPPFWCTAHRKPSKMHIEGRNLTTAPGGNVRFSIELVRQGFRFDETIGFGGGEDADFFIRALAHGFRIRETQNACTMEFVHPERMTYRAQFTRNFWVAVSSASRSSIISQVLYDIPAGFFRGILELTVSPIFALGGLIYFKRRALAGSKKIAKAFGRMAGLCGIRSQYYLKIAGE